MLVGNKSDEESGKREVSEKTGQALQVSNFFGSSNNIYHFRKSVDNMAYHKHISIYSIFVVANVEMQIYGNFRKERYECNRAIWRTLEARNKSHPIITTHRRNREKEWNEKNQRKMSLNVNQYSFFDLFFL